MSHSICIVASVSAGTGGAGGAAGAAGSGGAGGSLCLAIMITTKSPSAMPTSSQSEAEAQGPPVLQAGGILQNLASKSRNSNTYTSMHLAIQWREASYSGRTHYNYE